MPADIQGVVDTYNIRRVRIGTLIPATTSYYTGLDDVASNLVAEFAPLRTCRGEWNASVMESTLCETQCEMSLVTARVKFLDSIPHTPREI